MQTLGDFYSIITSSQSVLNLLYIGVALLFIFFISISNHMILTYRTVYASDLA